MSEGIKISAQTINDILEKLPSEKREKCAKDVFNAIMESGAVYDFMKATGNALGCEVSDLMKLPESIEWRDDEKDNEYIFRDESNLG